MSQIITFNVGGKHYDVSRSLLEKYPDTILTIGHLRQHAGRLKNSRSPLKDHSETNLSKQDKHKSSSFRLKNGKSTLRQKRMAIKVLGNDELMASQMKRSSGLKDANPRNIPIDTNQIDHKKLPMLSDDGRSQIAASKIGDDDNIDHPEPIFIERDGERYRYVLDYMRNGNVSLPSSVSRREFIRDLDYLGFHNLPLDSIPNNTRNLLIPDDLQHEYGVQFHQIIWDASTATRHGPCIVGLQRDNITLPDSFGNWSQVATAKTDDIIGTLINMKEMYCKEYRNGQRIRTLTLLPGIQYPCAIFQGYQEIISGEIPSEKNIFHFPREETRDNTIS